MNQYSSNVKDVMKVILLSLLFVSFTENEDTATNNGTEIRFNPEEPKSRRCYEQVTVNTV